LLIFFLVGSGLAQAQHLSGYGIKAGITAAELRVRGTSSDARWGATGSLFVTAPLTGPLGLLGEVGYHAKGSTFESFLPVEGSNDEFETIEVDNRFDYAFLLVAPQYANTLGTSGLRLFAFAGPRLDVFLGESISLSADPPEPGTSFIGDRDFRTFVVGMAAGVGLDFSPVLSVPLTVELRYNHDFTPAYSFAGGQFDIRNRTFDVRLGLSF
jgi:opacity protein-like surface antigen